MSPMASLDPGEYLNRPPADRVNEVAAIKARVGKEPAAVIASDLAKKIAAIEEKLAGFQYQLDAFQGIVLPLLTVHQMSKRKIGFNQKGGR